MPEPFESVLFEQPAAAATDTSAEPDFFHDFNLDQALDAILAGREDYDLAPLFYAPLHEIAGIQYRHDAVRDLQDPEIAEPIRAFAGQMRQMREHLAQVEKLRELRQKQAWFRDAAALYTSAVEALSNKLNAASLQSRAFAGLRSYLAAYVASEPYRVLAAETQAMAEALEAVDYSITIQGARVTVGRYDGEPDYSTEVEDVFARFKQGAVRSHLVQLPDWPDMNHIEARILNLVAALYPDVFGALAEYCARHEDYLDPTIARFDREVQFYLAYLEFAAVLERNGVRFCLPRIETQDGALGATDAFDIALANKLHRDGRAIVPNSFHLFGDERIIVITGPNNGGKTTFARMFGQLHYLASLGLPVPGSSARLLLPDRIYSHFEREEDIETLRGKLEDELVHVHGILGEATDRSVVVMNESFGSTTLIDSRFLGSEVLDTLTEIGALTVYVTFVDELATLNRATVSMVSEIVPDNPAERTYKINRRPADGLAYAAAIAAKYGVSYPRLMERVGS